MTPQFGASLTDDSRVIIYDHNLFMIQATGDLLPEIVLAGDTDTLIERQ